MLVVLVALTAIGVTARAVMLAADGTAGYGHLLAIAAAMVVSFAAGIACGSLFQAEPDRQPDRRHHPHPAHSSPLTPP
jgi:nitrate/nitrite transporter NarK